MAARYNMPATQATMVEYLNIFVICLSPLDPVMSNTRPSEQW